MGSTELQVFIALGVVLAAVLIALAVDFLKGSNERLRERNAALIEREKVAGARAAQMERHHAQLIELVEALKDAEQMRPVQPPAPMVRVRKAYVPQPSVEAEEPAGPLIPDAGFVVKTETPMPESPVAVKVVRDESMLVMADELIEEVPPMAELVIDASVHLAGKDRRTRRFLGEGAASIWLHEVAPVAPVAETRVEVPAWEDWFQVESAGEAAQAKAPLSGETTTEEVIEAPVEKMMEAPVEEMAAEVKEAPGEGRREARCDARGGGQAEARGEVGGEAAGEGQSAARCEERGETRGEGQREAGGEVRAPAQAELKVVEMPRIVPAAPATPVERQNRPVPGGVQLPAVLSELLLDEGTFFGVTLSISVVDYVRLVAENGKEAVEEVMTALEGLVLSSGSAEDLVCRISEDEFIVVCPGATGVVATSRVQQLSENLWDFQLRSLVSFPILFSWGASESGMVTHMPRLLADSVDRAREQMLESRRSRRALTWASAKYGLQSSAG